MVVVVVACRTELLLLRAIPRPHQYHSHHPLASALANPGACGTWASCASVTSAQGKACPPPQQQAVLRLPPRRRVMRVGACWGQWKWRGIRHPLPLHSATRITQLTNTVGSYQKRKRLAVSNIFIVRRTLFLSNPMNCDPQTSQHQNKKRKKNRWLKEQCFFNERVLESI